ncbi:MAG: ATP-binding cassette domain-containing protein, partial [Pseudohongiellaceae bacterium]
VSNELHNRYIRGWRVLEVVVSGFFSSVGLYQDSGATQTETARCWLMAFAIDGLATAYYHELSFGQQRLVLLARAMVKFPTVLILDEPCVGLDDQFRATVLSMIDCIAGHTGTHIIYVSHTTGEEPECINQRIRFVPAAGGGFTLVVS